MKQKNDAISWYEELFTDSDTTTLALEEIEKSIRDDPKEVENLIQIFKPETSIHKKLLIRYLKKAKNYSHINKKFFH